MACQSQTHVLSLERRLSVFLRFCQEKIYCLPEERRWKDWQITAKMLKPLVGTAVRQNIFMLANRKSYLQNINVGRVDSGML
jgi:hypothetical protein